MNVKQGKQNAIRRFLNVALAIVLTVGILPAVSAIAPKKDAYAREGGVQLDVCSYIEQNADAGKVGKADVSAVGQHVLKPTGKQLVVKHTLVDAEKIADDETIDSLFADSEAAKEKLVSVSTSAATVYELAPNAPCYVAFVEPSMFSGATLAPMDWCVAVFNITGTVVDEAEYDEETGLVYIPKHLYEDYGDIAGYGLQIQLLEPYSWEKSKTTVTVATDNNNSGVTAVAEAQEVRADILGCDIEIPLVEPEDAAKIGIEDIAVTVNGSNINLAASVDADGNRTAAAYDPSTGKLTIAAGGAATASVEVEIAGDAPLGAQRAYAYETPSSMDTLANFKFTNMNLSDMVIGDTFSYMADTSYYGSGGYNTDITDYLFENYTYSYGGDALSWNNNDIAQWMYSGSVSGDEGYYYLEPTADYEDCPIQISMLGASSVTSAGGKTVDFTYSATTWSSHGWDDQLALFCCHVDLTGNGNGGPGNREAVCRVLAKGDDYVVLGFFSSQTYTQSGFAAYKFAVESTGTVTLTKATAMPSITNGNSCYKLGGAEYWLVGDGGTFKATTNASGQATFEKVKPGTYTLEEKTASEGYVKTKTNVTPSNLTVATNKTVTVTSGNITDVSVYELPGNDPEIMRIWKADVELGEHLPEGAATLAGGEFTFRYYAGIYNSLDELPSTPTRTWVMRTNSNGYASPHDDNEYKVSGDEFYRNEYGEVIIPLGTITAVETKAPAGYLLDNGKGALPKIYMTKILYDATRPFGGKPDPVNYDGTESLTTLNTPIASDTVKRGNIEGIKLDSATTDGSAQGAATLAGAKIAVVNRNDNAVFSPESCTEVAYGGTVCTLTTDVTGAFSTTNAEVNGWSIPDGTDPTRLDGKGRLADLKGKALAEGTYYLYEAAPPTGYNLNSGWSALVTVDEDGQVIVLDQFTDDVKRGDIGFTKASSRTQKRLANVPFVVTSKTTGESHVVISDENGTVSTESAFNTHSENTNANDAAVTKVEEDEEVTYVVDESVLVQGAGVWFNGKGDATGAPVDDALGALPYDTYEFEEIRCTANAGLNLVTFTVEVTRDSYTIDLGTVDDQPGPVIATTLLTEQGIQTAAPDNAAQFTDNIQYGNFDEGTYTFTGEIHRISADGTDEGIIATATKQANIRVSFGYVSMNFVVNTKLYENQGGSFVAVERCTDAEGTVIAEHSDLGDTQQTIMVPAIETTLTDKADGDHEAPSTGTVTLTDTVAYSGLTPGERFTLTCTLHAKTDDGSDGGVLTDAHGDEVTAEESFTPAESSGTVDISMTFEPDGNGVDAVAYEVLSYGGTEIASHEDISDDAQTVHMPGIHTTALDSTNESHAATLGSALVVNDKVEYENLEVGGSYVLSGTLHKKDASGRDLGAFTDADGNAVSVSKSITAQSPSGTETLTFECSDELEPGCTAVVFEELRREGSDTLLADDAEIGNESQSVHAPAIKTTATEAKGGTHYADSGSEFTVNDAVEYSNLPTGVEYTLTATIHGVDSQGTDTGVLKDSKGNEIKVSTKFTPEGDSGTQTVEIAVDPTNIEGKFVVFEEASVNGVVVARHADITDEAQTIYVGYIETTAKDKDSGNHEGEGETKATVVDTVSYAGLRTSADYKLVGTLMDKSTGKAITENGKEITATKNFTTKESSGEVSMELTMQNTVLPGLDAVVFEKLYDANDNLVATHEDINSASQTVSYSAPGFGSAFGKAGYWFLQHWWLFAGIGALLVAAGLILRARGARMAKEPADMTAKGAQKIARAYFRSQGVKAKIENEWDYGDSWIFSVNDNGEDMFVEVSKETGETRGIDA